MNNRDATDTIKGYLYQFDHYIMEILKNSNENTLFYTEGIEDIDIVNLNKTTAVCQAPNKTDSSKKTHFHSKVCLPIFNRSHAF